MSTPNNGLDGMDILREKAFDAASRFLDERPENGACERCGTTVEPTKHPSDDKWLPVSDLCQSCRKRRKRYRRELNHRVKAFRSAYDSSGVTRRKRAILDPSTDGIDDIEAQFEREKQVAPRIDTLELEGALRPILEIPPGNPNAEPACAAFLHGPTGSGKTTQGQLAIRCYLIRWILTADEMHRVKARYTTTRGLVDAIKASYDGDERTQDVFDRYADADLLVLDELGQERGTRDESQRISKLIEVRNEAMLPTIYISNFGLNDLPGESPVYEGRTRWRIYEQCGGSLGQMRSKQMTSNFRDPRQRPDPDNNGGDQ